MRFIRSVSAYLEDCCPVFQVEGKKAPGPLFDFGLLMFHCGKILLENKSGPFFYLSKVTFSLSFSLFVCLTIQI